MSSSPGPTALLIIKALVTMFHPEAQAALRKEALAVIDRLLARNRSDKEWHSTLLDIRACLVSYEANRRATTAPAQPPKEH
jgi:hypothetical protein